ncbi:hypothetical protein [Bradyrhizobium sp. USDA 4454]
MNELILASLNGVAPYVMIAIGVVLVLTGLIARSRQKRFEVDQGQEELGLPRPHVAPLPHLLSPERKKEPDDS